MIKTLRRGIAGLALAALGAGCAPVAIVGGATAVGMSAADERGVGGVISDQEIRTQVNMAWFGYDPAISEQIELQVREGRVMLTGNVDTPQRQIDAVRLAWKVRGVKEVIDETKLGDEAGFGTYATDTWITTKLRAELLFDRNIRSVNYNIKTVNNVVFLMGIAQNQEELDLLMEKASKISGVRQVISHVRLKEEIYLPTAASEGATPLSYAHPSAILKPSPQGT